jgi:molybdenum cofactor guanylyltransferase
MPQIAGVILAGGAGTRVGGEKALLPFAGGTLLDSVIARAPQQVSQLALSVPEAAADIYRSRYPNYPLLFDSFAERVGPLAGVIAGLEWLRTLEAMKWLATFPCDTPFLPRDLVAQLTANAANVPVFAHDGERLQGACAVWPGHSLEPLREGVETGPLRSLQSAMNALGGKMCLIRGDTGAFFNINTRDDLARAEEMARNR